MPDLKTLFHRQDPETSKDAAEKMVKSGALSRQEQEVYDAINWYITFHYKTDFTAKEIGNYANFTSRKLDYYTIQRRLSCLHNKGKIERTGDKRGGCCVWRLT